MRPIASLIMLIASLISAPPAAVATGGRCARANRCSWALCMQALTTAPLASPHRCARACRCSWALCAAADGAPAQIAISTLGGALALVLTAARAARAHGGAGDASICFAR